MRVVMQIMVVAKAINTWPALQLPVELIINGQMAGVTPAALLMHSRNQLTAGWVDASRFSVR